MRAKADAFLRRCVNQGQVFCVPWITLTRYLRMATHPAILRQHGVRVQYTHDRGFREVPTLEVRDPVA